MSVASAGTGSGIAVGEKEFSITLATPLASGDNTLNVTNSGSFPHEVKIIKADSYAALPETADGSIDETALGTAVIAKIPKIAAGATGAGTVTLAPGNYVVVCNLGTGASNHATKGMHLDVTIS